MSNFSLLLNNYTSLLEQVQKSKKNLLVIDQISIEIVQ